MTKGFLNSPGYTGSVTFSPLQNLPFFLTPHFTSYIRKEKCCPAPPPPLLLSPFIKLCYFTKLILIQLHYCLAKHFPFFKESALGRFFHRVAMSVCLSVCVSPSLAIFFKASHWPSGHMIRSRPIIG